MKHNPNDKDHGLIDHNECINAVSALIAKILRKDTNADIKYDLCKPFIIISM